jgi:predicted nucleic acid-binding protein
LSFLVDANVLSEATKLRPSPKVVDWLVRHEAELQIDAVILGELEFGVLNLPSGRRRAALERWLRSTVFSMPCLPFDRDVAREWARLLALLRRKGAAMPIKDSLIAATALHHGLTVVTRNTRDFVRAGVSVVDSFERE